MPTLIVCRSVRDADHSRNRSALVKGVRFTAGNSLAGLMGIAPRVIVVCEGVDLRRDVSGEGSLYSILRQRQKTWGDKAQFIQLEGR